MLFVSINVSLEKISVKFPPFVNVSCCVIFELNKFAYDPTQSLRTTLMERLVIYKIVFSQTCSLRYLGYYRDNGNGAVIVLIILFSLSERWGNPGAFPVVRKSSKT